MDSDRLHLDEVFLSLQGEGMEVGRPQLFLRLGGCPLRCSYCDTPRSWTARPQYEVHLPSGTVQRDNPVDGQGLHDLLKDVLQVHGLVPADVMLSVTGGEPLQQAAFLEAWLPQWTGPILLETAGVHAEALRSVLSSVALLSMDWKLPSTLREGEDLLQAASCLAVAREQGTATQVKLVVTEETTDEEVATALTAIAAESPDCVVFLQPVTPFGKGPAAPDAARLLAWSLAHRSLPLDLRVLPQIHPLLGVR